jgi:tripartite-type tricarboxylate transporter receptor subunit TctC
MQNGRDETMIKATFYGLLAACLLGGAGSAVAQEAYPNKTVRLVVPSSPGGVTDVLARLVGQGLAQSWGKAVIIDNRPGADGVLGLDNVAKSESDGYTLLVTSDASITAGPHLHDHKRYDTLKDFTPIIILGQITPVFNVPASLPVNTFQEFLDLAKAKPDAMNYASFGNGTYAHLSMEDLKKRTGIKVMHLPYKGSTPATTALLRGEVAAMIVNLNVTADHARAGAVKILAAAGPARSAFRPDLPTIAELGVPGFETGAWWGLFGPADLPPEVVNKIRADANKFLDTAEARKFFEVNTVERVNLSPEELTKLIRRDYDHWGALIREVGIITK